MPNFDFLIGIAGNSARWRHSIEAPSLTHATNEIHKIASLSYWRVITDGESQSEQRAHDSATLTKENGAISRP